MAVKERIGKGQTEQAAKSQEPETELDRTVEQVEAERKAKERQRYSDWITSYRLEYQKIVDEAKLAQEMTSSPFWQSLYGKRREQHTRDMTRLGNALKSWGETVMMRGTNKEDEKAIKDTVKEITEEREAYRAWYHVSVSPVESLASRARNLLDNMTRQASSDSKSHELMNSGLPEYVREQVGSWPEIWWDEPSGMLIYRGLA